MICTRRLIPGGFFYSGSADAGSLHRRSPNLSSRDGFISDKFAAAKRGGAAPDKGDAH